MELEYSDIQLDDVNVCTVLMKKLWVDGEENELRDGLLSSISIGNWKNVLCKNKGKVIAFASFTIRNDYVEGSTTSPVGYIEGIFVENDYRGYGIAKALVNIGEKWAREKGCAQFASDTELKNIESQIFHEKIGFRLANKIVCFIKDI